MSEVSNTRTMVKGLLLNDCSHYHAGSRVVTENIREFARGAGLELQIAEQVEAIPTRPYDVVIINGEGTFHHNASRAFKLCRIAKEWKSRGSRLYLINALAQDIDIDFSIFNHIVLRETTSAEFVKRTYPANAITVAPDIAFLTKLPSCNVARQTQVLFIDSVASRYTQMMEFFATALNARFLRMTKWPGSFGSLSALISSHTLVITGRFHGAIIAMMTGTPFYALPSNSWKTKGMLYDFHASELYLEDDVSLRKALQKPPPKAVPVEIDRITEIWRNIFSGIVGNTL